MKRTIAGVIFLVVTAAYASDQEVTCTYFTSSGQKETFIFGDGWAVHQGRGVETGKPVQRDYQCWHSPPPFSCWDYSDAPRYKVLSREEDKVVGVYGNIESDLYPPLVVYYDVKCDD
ncbi:hypothetical protein [Ruegeria arenilitoris]|uniref:hypothetical protein n=1 Tax=Ruegeria arenilitoris TaxID=1173585 RepID=UPI00147C7E1A|nr:hypothetical protein [Ruegeria arenilitoris]